jgi:hypothetical protein
MAKSKLNKARDGGVKTCPASRHAHMIVDDLRSKTGLSKVLHGAGYDPDNMASSLEDVVLALWDARAVIQRTIDDSSQ